jgi:hypothetical protein
MTELQRFLEVFQIPGIKLYGYDKNSQRFVYNRTRKLDFKNTRNDQCINVAIVNLNINNETVYHAVYLTDTESACGLRLCPKCKLGVYDTINHKEAYRKHVERCEGKKPDKELRVRKIETPYCPGIYNNKTYEYLRANDRQKEFKPTEYYICYDFETMERINDDADMKLYIDVPSRCN